MLEQIENHGKHLHRAIDTTTCGVHKVPVGVPCWNMIKNAEEAGEGFYAAICGKRIRKAGFVGKISASSMRVKAPQKDDEKSGPRRSFSKKKTNDHRSSRRENTK